MKHIMMGFIVCISIALYASVSEVDTIRGFIEHVHELTAHLSPSDVLIIFDIDNTLVRPCGLVGSDEWFEHVFCQKMNEGVAIQEAFDLILPLYCHIQYHIKMQTVESETASLIQVLQQKGFFTVCLTARPHCIAEQTLQQLAEVGFSFKNNMISPFSFNVSSPVIHKDGVVFVGSQCKGDIAGKFIEKLGCKPKMVIFIDDKVRHVEAMHHAMASLDIEFHGFRYSYCDKHIDAFDAEHAERELTHILKYGTVTPAPIKNSQEII